MTGLYGKYGSLYAAARAALEAAADLIESPGKGFDGFSVDGLVSFNAADAGGRLCEPTDPAATTWSP
ncbi:hypothetical protein HY418_00825, partial [Candidatus Kaiserbacteria bacterium]|nr:hypothetical protein [Candidatus Kaiserbacteria bacterium]